MKYSRAVLSEQRGVTFVEVLIVLAIISLIFAVSMTLLQNYVGQESFRSSTQLFATELSGVIHDVRTDIWPEVNEIKCEDNGGILEYTHDSSSLPGRHRDCIFIGKAVQLGVHDGRSTPFSVSDESRDYIEHTLIGLASKNEDGPKEFQVFKNTGTPAETFDKSKARIVPHGSAVTKVYLLKTASSVNHNTLTPADFIYLDGFAVLLADFGEIDDPSTGDVLGGSRRISIWAIHADTDKDDPDRPLLSQPDFVTNTGNHITDSSPEYYHEIKDKPIYICLDSGQGDQAFIRIGSSQGSITAVVEQGEAVKKTLCYNP